MLYRQLSLWIHCVLLSLIPFPICYSHQERTPSLPLLNNYSLAYFSIRVADKQQRALHNIMCKKGTPWRVAKPQLRSTWGSLITELFQSIQAQASSLETRIQSGMGTFFFFLSSKGNILRIKIFPESKMVSSWGELWIPFGQTDAGLGEEGMHRSHQFSRGLPTAQGTSGPCREIRYPTAQVPFHLICSPTLTQTLRDPAGMYLPLESHLQNICNALPNWEKNMNGLSLLTLSSLKIPKPTCGS